MSAVLPRWRSAAGRSMAAARAIAGAGNELAVAGRAVHSYTPPNTPSHFSKAGSASQRPFSDNAGGAAAAGGGGPNLGDAADTWACLTRSWSTIKADVDHDTGVATVTLNRPEVLNALNSTVMEEVLSAMMYLDRQHRHARAIVLTGEGKAFAAGADIKEMSTLSYSEAYTRGLLNGWETLRSVRKPIIAAVNGFALGGGCELALMCDIVLAADTASFGQPEVTLGVLPGMGGTQRLTRAVGKSRAMEMILTGSRISAGEAVKIGMISRAVPGAELLPEARRLAAKIGEYSLPAVAKAKECVNVAFELGLGEGLRFEKREFWSCFALEDQREGMAAFLQKRAPVFQDK